MSTGSHHSLILTESGQCHSSGSNLNGQLGLGINYSMISKFVPIEMDEPIVMVGCGNQHSIILSEQGNLYTCGYNINGQLGLGGNMIQYTFKFVLNDPSIIQINHNYRIIKWTPILHRYFPNIFKSEVNLLYLCLKRYQNQIKIPKFVIYEIIKYI
jgi:alpha-tubulin suppressor-like RCC1 family protein